MDAPPRKAGMVAWPGALAPRPSSTTPRQMASDGTSMLPLPRTTLARAFISQTSALPAKTTSE